MRAVQTAPAGAIRDWEAYFQPSSLVNPLVCFRPAEAVISAREEYCNRTATVCQPPATLSCSPVSLKPSREADFTRPTDPCQPLSSARSARPPDRGCRLSPMVGRDLAVRPRSQGSDILFLCDPRRRMPW